MAISARYTDRDNHSITVVLGAGDSIGTESGHREILITVPSPGNNEYEELMRLVAAGEIEILPYQQATQEGPNIISDRQFSEGLWRLGMISYEEHLAFVGPGDIPGALLQILNQLPDDDTGEPTPRKVAIGLVKGAKEYDINNPIVDVVRQSIGWSVEKLRSTWTEWSKL